MIVRTIRATQGDLRPTVVRGALASLDIRIWAPGATPDVPKLVVDRAVSYRVGGRGPVVEGRTSAGGTLRIPSVPVGSTVECRILGRTYAIDVLREVGPKVVARLRSTPGEGQLEDITALVAASPSGNEKDAEATFGGAMVLATENLERFPREGRYLPRGSRGHFDGCHVIDCREDHRDQSPPPCMDVVFDAFVEACTVWKRALSVDLLTALPGGTLTPESAYSALWNPKSRLDGQEDARRGPGDWLLGACAGVEVRLDVLAPGDLVQISGGKRFHTAIVRERSDEVLTLWASSCAPDEPGCPWHKERGSRELPLHTGYGLPLELLEGIFEESHSSLAALREYQEDLDDEEAPRPTRIEDLCKMIPPAELARAYATVSPSPDEGLRLRRAARVLALEVVDPNLQPRTRFVAHYILSRVPLFHSILGCIEDMSEGTEEEDFLRAFCKQAIAVAEGIPKRDIETFSFPMERLRGLGARAFRLVAPRISVEAGANGADPNHGGGAP